jgi:hypothetical protein
MAKTDEIEALTITFRAMGDPVPARFRFRRLLKYAWRSCRFKATDYKIPAAASKASAPHRCA